MIRLAVMYYVRFPLSLRQVEDILHERGIDVTYETVRYGELTKIRLRSRLDLQPLQPGTPSF